MKMKAEKGITSGISFLFFFVKNENTRAWICFYWNLFILMERFILYRQRHRFKTPCERPYPKTYQNPVQQWSSHEILRHHLKVSTTLSRMLLETYQKLRHNDDFCGGKILLPNGQQSRVLTTLDSTWIPKTYQKPSNQ